MTSKGIPVVVCEYHQDVIQYIHRNIAKKQLPFNGIKMIHFDSHPDLAFPKTLNAEDCFDKEILYNDLDIADWILPLMYEGHLKDLTWIKSPWASQIRNLKTSFFVGKLKGSGMLRVTCTEDYFVEDGIYSPKYRLENTKKVNLNVTTIEELTTELDHHSIFTCNEEIDINLQTRGEENILTGLIGKVHAEDDLQQNNDSSCCKRIKLDEESCEKCDNFFLPTIDEKYILDIDLDFFTVMNPFLQDYSKEEYAKLKEIYFMDIPNDKLNEEELEIFVRKSQAKIDYLHRTITEFGKGNNMESTNENKNLLQFIQTLKAKRMKKKIDWELVHIAGLTTELPHHISTDKEIEKLLTEMEKLFYALPHPTLITIARSAEDEYCPPDQVDKIEEHVLDLIRKVYTNIDVHFDYKDDGRFISTSL